MKANFRIPLTQFVIVLWWNESKRKMEQTTINWPANNDMLRVRMLQSKVGYSQIRGVRPVDGGAIASSMMRLGRF